MMWVKVNVYNLKDGLRLRIGQSDCDEDGITDHQPDFVFFASKEGMGDMPISILRKGSRLTRNSIQEAYWREMEPQYDDGWRTDMILWVHKERKFETIPYAESYNNDIYRLSENKTCDEDKNWRHSLVFYAFPKDPGSFIYVSIGIYPRYDTTRVAMGLNAEDDMYKHDFTFKGLSEPQPGTIPIAVGVTGETDDRRHRVSQGQNAGDSGWTHQFVFHAFKQEKPGTIPIAVGHAAFRGGWKYRVSQANFAGDRGWTHDCIFYVYPVDRAS